MSHMIKSSKPGLWEEKLAVLGIHFVCAFISMIINRIVCLRRRDFIVTYISNRSNVKSQNVNLDKQKDVKS